MGEFAREVDRQENGAAEGTVGGQRLEGLLPHDCRPRASPRKLFAQLFWRRKRIVLGHRRAERENGEKCDDVLRAVGHDEGDDVAAAHPQPVQGLRGLPRLMGEFRIRDCASKKIDGH